MIKNSRKQGKSDRLRKTKGLYLFYMNENKIKRLHLIYACVLSGLLLVTSVLFIVSCIGIYHSGDRPFTRESIGIAFRRIAPVVYVTLAAIVGAIVIKLALPYNKKSKGNIPLSMTLHRLSKRCPLDMCGELERAKIERERAIRRILTYGGAAIIALSLIFSLIYVLTPGRFPYEDVNEEVATAVVVVFAFFLQSLIYALACSFYINASYAREIEYIKEATARLASEGIKVAPIEETECPTKKKITLIARCVIPVVAIVFIILGISNGGMNDVLQKAVRICTECIGMG